ncbi:P2Y purinoceptor 3 [Myripristis murdjan]|uniref:P2Y purinoceptor 3 n=1 Tax=Myripristis murdjan TaxID=586833 RepID=UPI00117624CE|nr:P2Y purinoceptor 6 [Myripristis murdjan]XP_029923788.1 P2Y purinoceptor 6 [Myripristis murdjan]XP_029923789.1 P2Y purinoceptor 6 [Myripristis murdjan]
MPLLSVKSFPTETFLLGSFPSSDFYSSDFHPTEPYTVESFTASVSNLTSLGRSVGPRCTYKEDFKRILLPAVYSFVFLLGLPLNAAVILKIWKARPNLSRNNIYMLNLATADFLYVMSLPLLIYNYASHDYWPFGELACKLVRFQFYSNLHGSILFLTCISIQRYVGICHPLATWHKQGGRRLAWCICGGVWLVVVALCAPTFHFASTGIQRNRTVCYDLSRPEHSLDYYPYGMALTCLGFLLPFMGVVVCYCRMACFLCRPVSYQGVSVATGEKRDKAVRMIIIVVAVFCISFLPFHLTKTMYLLVRTLPKAPCEMRNLFSVIYKSTRPFASMNSVLDPILFYFTQPRYRKSTRRFMLKVTTLKDKGTSV